LLICDVKVPNVAGKLGPAPILSEEYATRGVVPCANISLAGVIVELKVSKKTEALVQLAANQ
jgi:hypothetical protein